MKPIVVLIIVTFFSHMVQADEIPLIHKNELYYIKATVNDKIQLEFAIDSGSSTVVIPNKIFQQLKANGSIRSSDILGKREIQLASGEMRESLFFKINTLKIGLKEIKNVTASVGKDNSIFLLGQSALRKLEPWHFDRQKGIFRFGSDKIKTYRKNYVSASQNINRNEVLDFIRYFITLQNDKQLEKIMKLYASNVDYLDHGMITHENVSIEKENYFTRQQKIEVYLLKLNETKDVLGHPEQKVVNYCVTTHLCEEDKYCKRERYNITLKLEKKNGTIKIISEKVKYLEEGTYH